MDKQRPPFYYLDEQINILLVDDDPKIVSLLTRVLSPLRLYKIQSASSSAEGERILSSPNRTHLCVFDLGLDDIENDEFHLLRRFAGKVSFVVLTGSSSPHKGYVCHELGAKTLVEKSGKFDGEAFRKTVNHYSLLNVINPRYGMGPDSLTTSTEVLFDRSPQFVSQWAMEMGITDRELRNLWTKNLGANTKIILAIYQMFEAALTYYEKTVVSKKQYRNVNVEGQGGYRRLEEYFHLHRSIITDYIAYGNVVNFQ